MQNSRNCMKNLMERYKILKWERQMLSSSRLQPTACPCARAIDRLSQKPTRALANQSATSRLRHSKRHVPAVPIRTRELPSRPSGQRQILTHFDESHYTRTPHATSRSRLYNFQYKFSSSLVAFPKHAFLSLGHFKSAISQPPTFKVCKNVVG